MKQLLLLHSLKRAAASFLALAAWALLPAAVFGQTPLGDISTIDEELLNNYLLAEVNAYRKKARVAPLTVRTELSAAARHHVRYMHSKARLTHTERFNKPMKTPKNRVDFYGGQFDRVGENVQLNNLRPGARADDKKNPPITTYEQLAGALALAWRNSPPHYANMIHPDFASTYTAISLSGDGEVYACQLFGGAVYFDKYRELNDTVNYKPESDARCRWCNSRLPIGNVIVTEDRELYFVFQTRLRMPRWKASRMRLFNPWNDGIAADIVLKSQYPCDSSSFFNGRRGVRGIPLPPVYKKDFGPIGVFNTSIYLGRVPDYIDEEFEVNLTVIKNKRTCTGIQYHVIPAGFHVEIPLSFGFEPKDATLRQLVRDTITERLSFGKSRIVPDDTTALAALSQFILENNDQLVQIDLRGFASIEGSTENNIHLYRERANYLSRYLQAHGIDSGKIRVSAGENFGDFRTAVTGTPYEELGGLTDRELKERLTDAALVRALEPILQKQRYVEVQLITRDTTILRYSKTILQHLLASAIEQRNKQQCIALQRIQYRLLLDGEMELSDLDSVAYPMDKRFFLPLHNEAVMRFELDSLHPQRYERLQHDLGELVHLDSTNERLRTSLAILEYYNYTRGALHMPHRKYYKQLRQKKHVDPVQQSRMLLNFATATDWKQRKPIYAGRVKRVIPTADLSAEKTFEIASYYAYFDMERIAYELTKRKIDDTENPEHLVFFLKLIHLTEIPLSRHEYLRYFERIRKYSGTAFCTFFHSPALNFQLLDDEELKAIYCEECGK